MKILFKFSILAFLIVCFPATASQKARFQKVETFPLSLSKECRSGTARIYDECGSQVAIFKAALKRANETDKSVLLVYGTEWCIWCHVFDKYIKGGHKEFSYKWEVDGEQQNWDMREQANKEALEQAKKLNKFVADNFVVAHIEGYFAADGLEVIKLIGFDTTKMKFYPFIFSISADGKYAAHMLAYDAIPGLEVREDSGREYRGFDREILLQELQTLRSKAKEPAQEGK